LAGGELVTALIGGRPKLAMGDRLVATGDRRGQEREDENRRAQGAAAFRPASSAAGGVK